jgi:transposase
MTGPLRSGVIGVGQQKRGATKQGAWIVHLDESGFSERPNVRRTWSPKGKTPLLRTPFNWKRMSAIGAIALSPDRRRVRTFLHLHPGPIRAPQVVAFLRSLRRHLPGKVLLVWDRLGAHRSRLVKDYLAGQQRWLEVEWLPAYAPELNPVEYLWHHLKSGSSAHFCADGLSDLSAQVKRRLRRVRRSDLAWSFLKHSGLYPALLY